LKDGFNWQIFKCASGYYDLVLHPFLPLGFRLYDLEMDKNGEGLIAGLCVRSWVLKLMVVVGCGDFNTCLLAPKHPGRINPGHEERCAQRQVSWVKR
jgi:hypothetical protein